MSDMDHLEVVARAASSETPWRWEALKPGERMYWIGVAQRVLSALGAEGDKA